MGAAKSGIPRTANIENVNSESLQKLRLAINEGSRVQRGGADPISYIDVSNSLIDVAARQNHAIFGRRGCGKTLLLHDSGKKLAGDIRTVYLNCEDFKKHSFPNVLIEILDALSARLESELTGWFGRKRRSRQLITEIRKQLSELQKKADKQDTDVREAEAKEVKSSDKAQASVVRHAECRLWRALRARFTFSRMSAALAVQMNGFGFSL